MNGHAHMSGQLPGQVPTQAGPQVSDSAQQISSTLASQMQSLGPRTMDHELNNMRSMMCDKILKHFQRNANCDALLHKLPELPRRLEERLYKEARSKEDYMKLIMETSELRLNSMLKNIVQSIQPSSHQVTSSATFSTMIPTPGTMIPTPGITQNRITNLVENPNIAASSGIMTQPTANIGNLLPAATDIGNSTSLNAPDGPVSNGHKHQAINYGFGSSGSNLMTSMTSNNSQRQLPQMIPTPGFNNPQTMSMSSEPSSGSGFPNTESTISLTAQQQSKYVSNQNSHLVHGMGGQIGTGRSNMQHKPSSYGLSNGLSNGKSSFIGSNMQLNGAVTSDGLLSTAAYGNSVKPFRQHFEQQHHHSSISTSLPQNILPIVGDNYPTKAAEMAGSETFRNSNSSVLSPMSNISTGLHAMSRTNSGMLNSHASLQSLQHSAHVRPNMLDRQQKLNFQSSQSTTDHLLQAQHQMQQYQQQPNQIFVQFAHNQYQLQRQPQSLQNQRLAIKNDSLRQPSLTPTFGNNLIPGSSVIAQSETLLSQATQQVHLSELQSQYQLNIHSEDHSKNTQFIGHLPGSRELNAATSDLSQHLLRPHQEEFVNKVGSPSGQLQVEEFLKTQWQSNPLHTSQLPEMPSSEQLKEELHQRIIGQHDAQRPHIASDGCITISAASPARQFSAGMVHVPEDSRKETSIINQRRWLLFLYHASRCSAPKGQCKEVYCWSAQDLVMHIRSCDVSNGCPYPRCSQSKKLVNHFQICRAANCPVCIFVRDFIKKCKTRALSDTGFISKTKIVNERTNIDALPSEISDERQILPKRMRIQHAPFDSKDEIFPVCATPKSQPYGIQIRQPQESEQFDMKIPSKLEVNDVKMDQAVVSEQENFPVILSNVDEGLIAERCEAEPLSSSYVDCHVKQEISMTEKEPDHPATEVKLEESELSADQTTAGKSGKPKIKGVSLTELFTPEQIREHIVGLRQWVGQSKAKAEKNQAMEHSMSENSCQLCAVEKLTFEPPPIYCSPCGARIKRNAMYYTIGAGETRHYFCIPCYNEARGDTIEVDGSSFPKAKLEKKKNDEETEEWWVQCDKCEAWQHQICALFNGRRNDGEAEYTCPNCLIHEIERGERKPLPQSAVLGAKDLPKTILSDHIEQRLVKRLKQERLERARHFGKSFDEVPGAEGLVVRVVSSVDKKLEVKQRFLEIYQEENYPKEFPYKSKAILLFQKIEGVEVCLFGMYVQEFGSECAFPNQRRVYLSYLDSVKYFRPEIRTVTGEALRTFVYHEILIGYLEYCKKRGFTSCYIWACPPLKGEDYILYCHPEIQKTPKSDKLREWYLSMLRKASKENIVVDLTNLYDHFFTTIGECKAKVTAARLPYFDGDYWPGAAEDMINQLRHEEDGRNKQKKGKTKKTLTKRALKAAGQSDLSGNASKDALLMQKLGETIFPMKEDFIMVHLQHCCNHCCILMVSGRRWVCNQCKNFQLCDKCYEAEQRLEERDRHPIHGREKHGFHPVEINDVASDTKDIDEILESEFFDTRQAFLSLCQGNHYQYDTLRRAKHSSMMVLYHLHNPTAPAFVTTCNVCHHDIDTGQGWRCEVCPDFDVCDNCFKKEGAFDHPHKLTNHPSIADRDAQNKEARQKRVLQLRKMLDLLVHASQCRFPHCQYPNCRKVKRLFRHGIQCPIRASGGCVLCKKMWYLLQIHARACKESECNVPRCRDLKEHLRRLQQQSDSRRRAAVMEMMRQRAAEVAGNG